VRHTLGTLSIPRATFYRWYDRYSSGGPEALNDRSPRPDRVWNRIPDAERQRIIELALDEPALSPRELAVRFTDTKGYFVSEASVYRLLKAAELIAGPAFIVIKAADAFKNKTTAPNQLWQTDFTYLKVIGWGWFYLSTVLDDVSRYIVAWKLCTTMTAQDAIATLDLALRAAGLVEAEPRRRPRLLSDNGSSYVAGDLAKWLGNLARETKDERLAFMAHSWIFERAWGKPKDFDPKDEAPAKPKFDPRLLPREQLEIVQYALRLMVGAMRGPGETSEIEAEPD
jgi:putative transposase